MQNHQLINASSSDVEYFTPPSIVSAARWFFNGVVHLDPASCHAANQNVGAVRFMTKEQDAISLPWVGETVFLNFPFGRQEPACSPDCTKKHVHHDYDLHGNAAWVSKLVSEFSAGNFNEACCLCYAATSEKWFRPLLNYPQCFLHGRTNYLLPDGTVKKGVTKGSVVTYLGPNVNRFAQSFKHLGTVKLPYQY